MAATTLTVTLWLIGITLILIGVAGTVLPALPGVFFVFLGILLTAWIDDFSVVSGLTVGICLAITIVAWVLDYIAGILGAKKVGASREAIVGSFIGTIAGVFSGLWGLLFMPCWAPPSASTSTTATSSAPATSASPPGWAWSSACSSRSPSPS